MSSGAADFKPTHPKDDQFYQCIDVQATRRSRSRSAAGGCPARKQGDNVAPPTRHTGASLDTGFRPHNTNVYPRAAGPRVHGLYRRRHDHPRHRRQGAPEDGRRAGTTTRRTPALPIPWCRSSSATCWSSATRRPATTAPTGRSWCGSSTTAPRKTRCRSRPARCRRSRRSRAAAAATGRTICGRTCRRKAAGSPRPSCSARSSTAACGPSTCRTRTSRRRSAYFAPQVENAPTGACQINDVFVDDRGIVFCVDRHVGGLYALEMDF